GRAASAALCFLSLSSSFRAAPAAEEFEAASQSYRRRSECDARARLSTGSSRVPCGPEANFAFSAARTRSAFGVGFTADTVRQRAGGGNYRTRHFGGARGTRNSKRGERWLPGHHRGVQLGFGSTNATCPAPLPRTSVSAASTRPPSHNVVLCVRCPCVHPVHLHREASRCRHPSDIYGLLGAPVVRLPQFARGCSCVRCRSANARTSMHSARADDPVHPLRVEVLRRPRGRKYRSLRRRSPITSSTSTCRLHQLMIDAFLQVMNWPASFWLPADPRDLEFLFLPSDTQYCGPAGPEDRDYDPRPAPVADDSYTQVRVLMPPVSPPQPDAELADDAPAAISPRARNSWFPELRQSAESYNFLRRLAVAREDPPIDMSRVDQGQTRSQNFLISDIWRDVPRDDDDNPEGGGRDEGALPPSDHVTRSQARASHASASTTRHTPAPATSGSTSASTTSRRIATATAPSSHRSTRSRTTTAVAFLSSTSVFSVPMPLATSEPSSVTAPAPPSASGSSSATVAPGGSSSSSNTSAPGSAAADMPPAP
ncbi:MAG: hypothetical protein BJ554DRAFT_5244, partial [Olpidium bornovanus]